MAGHSPAPETLVVGGHEYVRKDVAGTARAPGGVERTYSVRELSDMSGYSIWSIYRAMSSGRLAYECPGEGGSGRRVSESDWDEYRRSVRVGVTR